MYFCNFFSLWVPVSQPCFGLASEPCHLPLFLCWREAAVMGRLPCGPHALTLFSIKDQRVNIKGFSSHIVCVAATQLCYDSTKTATGNRWTNVPIKLHLYTQGTGWIWPTDQFADLCCGLWSSFCSSSMSSLQNLGSHSLSAEPLSCHSGHLSSLWMRDFNWLLYLRRSLYPTWTPDHQLYCLHSSQTEKISLTWFLTLLSVSLL